MCAIEQKPHLSSDIFRTSIRSSVRRDIEKETHFSHFVSTQSIYFSHLQSAHDNTHSDGIQLHSIISLAQSLNTRLPHIDSIQTNRCSFRMAHNSISQTIEHILISTSRYHTHDIVISRSHIPNRRNFPIAHIMKAHVHFLLANNVNVVTFSYAYSEKETQLSVLYAIGKKKHFSTDFNAHCTIIYNDVRFWVNIAFISRWRTSTRSSLLRVIKRRKRVFHPITYTVCI